MAYKKAYKIVRTVILIGMAAMFIVIDSLVFIYHDYILYLLFIPIESAFVVLWWLLLVKYNNNSIIKIETNKGKIFITTLGKDYTVSADRIRVKKGRLHHYLFFKGIKLRANAHNKSVKSFIYKYQKIYKTIRK